MFYSELGFLLGSKCFKLAYLWIYFVYISFLIKEGFVGVGRGGLMLEEFILDNLLCK